MGKKFRPVKRAGDYARTFSTEDGEHFRGHHQDIGPAIKHVEHLRHKMAHAQKGRFIERHVGSVPTVILMDWLKNTGHTMQQWAVNAGGDPYKKYPGGPGVYDQFLKYFLTREFSKLHNNHVTTKSESSQILVPSYIGGKDVAKQPDRVENGSKELAGSS